MSKLLQRPLFGLDSTGMVPISGHRQIGSTFACRYLSHFTPKVVTPAEVAAYRSSHIGLVLVFEDGARNAWAGRQQGVSDASFAEEQARSLGLKGAVIYFAVDDDPTNDSPGTDAYFDGVRQVLGDRAGVYGGYTVVKRQLDRGLKWAWQTYAWSAGRWDTRAHIQQYSNNHVVDGVGVDFNHAMVANYGQVGYVPPVPPDPFQYHRFQVGPFPYGHQTLDERDVVKAYDHYRAKQTLIHHPNRAELSVLRTQCTFLADRIEFLERPVSPVFGAPDQRFDREWRKAELRKRAKGKRAKPVKA